MIKFVPAAEKDEHVLEVFVIVQGYQIECRGRRRHQSVVLLCGKKRAMDWENQSDKNEKAAQCACRWDWRGGIWDDPEREKRRKEIPPLTPYRVSTKSRMQLSEIRGERNPKVERRSDRKSWGVMQGRDSWISFGTGGSAEGSLPFRPLWSSSSFARSSLEYLSGPWPWPLSYGFRPRTRDCRGRLINGFDFGCWQSNR